MTRIIYRVEHIGTRGGCFSEEDKIGKGYHDNYDRWLRRWDRYRAHLRSMPRPCDDFGLNNIDIGDTIIFAFPSVESTMYWLNYPYRRALQRAGFVVGLYKIKKAYRISDCQVMFTRHTAVHLGDMPLVRAYKKGR